MSMVGRSRKKVGVLWRAERYTLLAESRYGFVGEALAQRGLVVEGVPYTDDALAEVREQLLGLDGVLVWVDPITDEGKNRSVLDPLLREIAAQGVWVSTHPDVILKMGTKDVLVKTRNVAWGSDCHLYGTSAEMAAQLPLRLALGPHVLKQHRGNGGNGVWKVEFAEQRVPDAHATVRVLHAQRESYPEVMPLGQFIQRCEMYFADGGCMIDQPYQARLGEGMIRCYMVRDRVAGFGQQFVTALLPLPEGTRQTPAPPPRQYYGPTQPEFQGIKARLESGWIAEMQQILGIASEDLPVLWDADFLYGPKDATGQDTYVLCEINVSCVSPFPDEALAPLVDAVNRRLHGIK